MIHYISTRGHATPLTLKEAVLTGLAPDGGLYVPEYYPSFSPDDLRKLRGKSYVEIAQFILWPYIKGTIEWDIFQDMLLKAYQPFQHEAICPLVQTNDYEFLLELFHGPTLAFKDFAMQLLSQMMDYFLTKSNLHSTIVGATSGDTGSAAMAAFKNVENINIFMLFPKGKISSIQQKQMTSYSEKNIHTLAIEGNFDDCQSLVKSLFNDQEFRKKTSLSAINSINWARIMAQIVYYFSSAITLGAPDRALSFTVPTGNFGDIFAGFVASRMGLPIAQLIIATNENDILPRTLETGIYKIEQLLHTSSPSMDIQVSSNFERLLFEVEDRNSEIVQTKMKKLQETGEFSLSTHALSQIKSLFQADRATEEKVLDMIQKIYQNNGYLLDPHSAVGLSVARRYKKDHIPMIILSTAHPAKFPETIKKACNVTPSLPNHLQDLIHKKEERLTILPKDEIILKNFILQNI